MEPTRDTQATLVDLLDRILDKGLVINADIIISVAGIPLIGVNLRAALAGMETMLRYGVMQAWDERTRAWEREHRKKKELSLIGEEEVILKMFGSYYYSEEIYTAWRSGYFYLTDKRLILYRPDFNEVIFQTPLEKIRGLAIRKERHFTKERKDVLYLILQNDGVAQLYARDTNQLKKAIEERVEIIGLTLEDNLILPEFEKRVVKFLTDGEQIACRGKMWYLMALPSPGGVISETWKPGYLYITDKRLCWWCDFDKKIAFDIPIGRIIASAMDLRDPSSVLKKKRALNVIYQIEQGKRVACFSGDKLGRWEKALNQIISRQSAAASEVDTETCPQCGQEASTKKLLEKGCSRCGWISPRLKQRTENRSQKIEVLTSDL